MSTEATELPIMTSAPKEDTLDASGENTSDPANTQLMTPVICYRDPADVRTIRRQSWLIILSFVITAIAVVGVVYKSIQRPDRIVVDMTSGRTVMINNRELGATEAVRLEKDKLQIADMEYVVKAYLDYLYRVDQRSRSKDIEDNKLSPRALVCFDHDSGATTDRDTDKTSNATVAHAPCSKTIGNAELATEDVVRLLCWRSKSGCDKG